MGCLPCPPCLAWGSGLWGCEGEKGRDFVTSCPFVCNPLCVLFFHIGPLAGGSHELVTGQCWCVLFCQKGSLGANCVQPTTAAHSACYCLWDPSCALEHRGAAVGEGGKGQGAMAVCTPPCCCSFLQHPAPRAGAPAQQVAFFPINLCQALLPIFRFAVLCSGHSGERQCRPLPIPKIPGETEDTQGGFHGQR